MRSGRVCLLLSVLLLSGEANEYRNPTVTSAPVHVSTAPLQQHYQPHIFHQQQQTPSVLSQSYQVLPEPKSHYQYPQYLPTHSGYTNVQSLGQPYQMYSGPDASSYGLPAPVPVPIPSPSPATLSHRVATVAPTPPSPFATHPVVENQHSRSPAHHHSPAHHQALVQHQAPAQFPFAPKPILSYGSANPFLANLPPAHGVYGAAIEDASNTGYDGAPSSAPPASSSASVDDTWEALEASLDASTRRRHRFSN